jgi:hypothetical protein
VEKLIGIVLGVILIPPTVFMVYVILVVIPVQLYTEAQCLRQGYPKASVTVGLERYCSNLQGSVTVKVDHQ